MDFGFIIVSCSFYTIGKVGSGFDKEQLDSLNETLKPHLIKYDVRNTYAWLAPWKPEAKDFPDCLIQPDQYCYLLDYHVMSQFDCDRSASL